MLIFAASKSYKQSIHKVLEMDYKKLLIGLATVFMVACSTGNDKEDEPSVTPTPTPTPEPPAPVEVVINLDREQAEVGIGQTITLVATVDPADTPIEWESADTRIATVDDNGVVTGVARGSVAVKATAGNASAECLVKVVKPVAVGDYYYSDGTTSSVLSTTRSVLGVVFWVGDPTADDAQLRADHPKCTHGLVVAAFADMTACAWQLDPTGYNNTVSAWIQVNAPKYQIISSAWMEDVRRNSILGYNNTKAMEAFNNANSAHALPVITKVRQYRESEVAPESSSGWFLPSTKELTLLINGEHDGDVFDFNNISKDKCLANKAVINASLQEIEGAELMGRNDWAYDYWSSTEWDKSQAYQVSTYKGNVMGSQKSASNNQLVRCVLAF